MHRLVTRPALGPREVSDSVAVTLQAQAPRVEPEQVRVRRAVRLVALDAASHQPAADGAMLEAEGAPLREMAGSAQVGDVPVADPAVRLVAVRALDALLVLDEDRMVAVESEQTPDLVVALNADGRLGPRDVLAVGFGRAIGGVALPALDLTRMVVALAPHDRGDLF